MAAPLSASRAWAPLGLMLVLTCGAWFFHDVPQTVAPQPTVSAQGWIQPSLGSIDAKPTREAGGGQGPGGQAPSAEQVLEEVSRRGRLADQARADASSSAANADRVNTPQALQARVRQDPAGVHRQTAGQRLRLQGTLAGVEAGEPGVLVLHLALPGEEGSVRVVASPALAAMASDWAPSRAVSLDCLSQGVMMGEWLLVDCRQ